MPEEKKTEEQLRHDIRRKYSLSESNDKDKAVIDGMLKEKKDSFKTRQKLKEKSGESTTDKKEAESQEHSLKDIRALNNVHDDDVDKVTDYAKKFGLSVSEALKDDDLKAILKGREEERKASDAVDTGKKRSGSSKIDGNKVLERMKKNPSQELSDEEMEAATDARWKQKHSKS